MMSVLSEQTGEYMGIKWKASLNHFYWSGFVILGTKGLISLQYTKCIYFSDVEVDYNRDGLIGYRFWHKPCDLPHVIIVLQKTIHAIIQMVDVKPKRGPCAINDFIDRRDSARVGAIAVIGALRSPAFGAGTGDVAKIIARVVWSTRVFYK